MPEYFDSKSSKPKKTKKTRYAGGGKFEGVPEEMLRKGRKGIRHAKKKYGKTAKSGPRTGEAVSGAKRSSGGWASGGSIETFNSQVQRKYHGGSVKRKQAGGSQKYSDEFLKSQGINPSSFRKSWRKIEKQKRQNILSGKSVRTRQPKRITSKKGPKGG